MGSMAQYKNQIFLACELGYLSRAGGMMGGLELQVCSSWVIESMVSMVLGSFKLCLSLTAIFSGT